MKAAPIFDLGEPTPEHEPEFWLPVLTEAEFRELAAGRVPDWIRDQCRSCVDWSLETGDLSFVGRGEQRQRKGKKTTMRAATFVSGETRT